MLLNKEKKSGEYDKEHSEKWLVNTDPDQIKHAARSLFYTVPQRNLFRKKLRIKKKKNRHIGQSSIEL